MVRFFFFTNVHMSAAFDLIVVGSGILGLSHALAAAKKGLTVAVLDRNFSVQNASVRNFGFLTQLYNDNGSWGKRAARSREIYHELASIGAIPLNLTGSLQLLQSHAQFECAKLFVERVNSPKIKLLSVEEAISKCPAVPKGEKLYGAIAFEEDCLLEPRLMFKSLKGYLEEHLKVSFFYGHHVSGIEKTQGSSPRQLCVTSSSGLSLFASHVVYCTGDDISSLSLFPALVKAEASKLTLCKLQMARLSIEGAGDITMPLTSGLSLRRYPALSAVCPAEYEAMMKSDTEGADEEAERLGIHVIVRPAPLLTRGTFGEISSENPLSSASLSRTEVIVGDSHQYSPIGVPPTFDETVDEEVLNEILRITKDMVVGVDELYNQRTGKGSTNAGTRPSAKILSQWCGTYLQHTDGILNSNLELHHADRSISQLSDLEAREKLSDGIVKVITAIGGKGMTMSPALAEETIQLLFPTA
jgi:D-hydroxyproline dehydrogenase subunit beta